MAKVDIGLVRSDLGQQQVHGCDPIAIGKKEAYQLHSAMTAAV
jgi:hypothetical protein